MAIIHADGFAHYKDLLDEAILKEFYKPVFKQYDHQLDALSLNFHHRDRNTFNLGETEKRKREWIDAFREHGNYIDPDRPKSAFDLMFNPDVVNAFIWGPRGEWIGAIKTEEAIRQFQGSPTGRLSLGGRHWHMKIAYVGYDGELVDPYQYYKTNAYYDPYGRRSDYPMLVQFDSYNDMAEYIEVAEASYGRRRRSYNFTMELAGLIQNIRPQRAALLEWIKALGEAKADYGFGCLHDGEGNMDPLGVLAEMNACDWVWDRREGAYKIKGGDAYTLPDKLLRDYLGIPEDCSDRHISEFKTYFPPMMDRHTSHKQVVAELTSAMDVITERLNEIRELRNKAPSMELRSVADGPSMDEMATLTRYDRLDLLGGNDRRYDIVVRPERITKMDWT